MCDNMAHGTVSVHTSITLYLHLHPWSLHKLYIAQQQDGCKYPHYVWKWDAQYWQGLLQYRMGWVQLFIAAVTIYSGNYVLER